MYTPKHTPKYQGGKPPTGYKGDRGEQRPSPKGQGKRRKRYQVKPTRAMMRYLRNQHISEAFVDICRGNMTPELFEKVLAAAKRRADKVPSAQEDFRFETLSYKIVNELRRTADKTVKENQEEKP